MPRLFILILLLPLAHTFDIHTAFRQTATCPHIIPNDIPPATNSTMVSLTPAIVGGIFASPALLPYLAAIITTANGSTFFCTATMISPTWAITASHCRFNNNSFAVVLSSRIGHSGARVELASYHRHPKFIVGTVASPYDIALVRFRTSFAGTSLKFMPLNGNKAYPMKHAFVRNIGYGRAHHSLPSAASFSLRQVDVPHVRAARANNFYARLSPATRIVKRFQMATGYLRDGNCGICNGDSGGPVIQYAGDQPILIGVASASVQCTSSGYPDVSVRVSAHTEWITGLATNAVVHTGKVKQIVRHCRRGFILFSTNRAPARCVECAKDEVSIGGAARVCYQCVRNSLRDPGNGSTCSCVAAVGRGFSTNGGGSCVLCPRGRFSGVGDGNCRPCKEGSFASTRGSEKCLPCEGAPKGASRCDG